LNISNSDVSDELQLDRDYLQLDDPKYYERYDDWLRQLSLDQNRLLLNNEGLEIINDCHCKNILEEMQFFIENGADPNGKDDEGWTILHDLARNFSRGGPFSFEFINLLFKAGADPRIANDKGELPLEKFELPDYVVERFPERRENYGKLTDMFQKRTDELNAILSVE
jgi:hypothetical protein